MRNLKFTNQQIYHVFNRGTEKRNIFLDKKDYLRMIHALFVFNDKNPIPPSNIRIARHPTKTTAAQITQCLEAELPNIKKPRKLLVEILAFSLMSNHYHLLLKQCEENGISKFMQKLGTSYTNYFNTKHERSGHLFQGKFKAVEVRLHSQLLHLPYYIHLNPLGLKHPEWRNKEIKNPKEAFKYLNQYKWSSHQDYMGKKNFPSITSRDYLLELFGGEKSYKKAIKEWLEERKQNVKLIQELTLEK